MPTDSPRRFGLDLLRALAIAMVFACHAGLVFASWWGVRDPQHVAVSGYYGVEAFFVLSGFLIGPRLFAIATGATTLGRFMRRRWARTLPLYAVLLATLAALQPPVGGMRTVLPYVGFAQNLAWPTVGGWFSVSWSLAIEEWFYLLFPLALLPSARRLGPGRALALALAVFLLVPPALRFGAVPAGTNWNDVTRQVVVLRLDAIAFGVGAAALLGSARIGAWLRARRGVLALIGVAVLAVQWWGGLQGSGRVARAVHDVLAFDVTDGAWALTLPFLAALPMPRRLLAAPVHAVAARSYGLYLTHLTILEWCAAAVARGALARGEAVVLALACCVLVPSLTWRFLERPLLENWGRVAPVRLAVTPVP